MQKSRFQLNKKIEFTGGKSSKGGGAEVPVGAIIGGPFAALIGSALDTVFEAVETEKRQRLLTPKSSRRPRRRRR